VPLVPFYKWGSALSSPHHYCLREFSTLWFSLSLFNNQCSCGQVPVEALAAFISFYYGVRLLIHLAILLECPSPPPLLIMSLQQKTWIDKKQKTKKNQAVSIISLRHCNKRCKTTDDSKSEFCAITV
jgi:hypothetical protein